MLAQSLMVIIAEKVVLRQGHSLPRVIWCAEEARLRLLRARVTMAGHDSLCLLPFPSCSSVVRIATRPHRSCLNLTTTGETSKTASIFAKRQNGRQVTTGG